MEKIRELKRKKKEALTLLNEELESDKEYSAFLKRKQDASRAFNDHREMLMNEPELKSIRQEIDDIAHSIRIQEESLSEEMLVIISPENGEELATGAVLESDEQLIYTQVKASIKTVAPKKNRHED